MTSALHTHRDEVAGVGGTDAHHARLAMGGLLAAQGPGALDTRTGVLHGPGSTSLLIGTSDTGPMTVAINAHHWVTSRGAANGSYLGVTPAVVKVPVSAAPASGSRTDVVWVKQQDKASGVPTPDTTSAPQWGVLTGPANGTKPDLAAEVVGAEELGTVVLTPSAIRTDGAGVTITNTARQTVARGAPIPVRSAGERDAIAKWPGCLVIRLDVGGRIERWTGSRWAGPGAADVTVGDDYLTAQVVVASGSSWTDVATVTGPSAGGECVARFTAVAFNGNSGSDRSMYWRVTCDGVAISPLVSAPIPLAGLPRVTRVGAFSSTPAVGSHTWKLQANASAASAIFADTALLTVVEKG